MPSLDGLPVDILVAVLKDHYEDRHGLWTLSVVSRSFRKAVRIVRRSGGRKTTEYKGKRAWDESCEWGSLVSVKFLHANRKNGCTTDAMNFAARHGHLEVVKFLHENRGMGRQVSDTRRLDRCCRELLQHKAC